MGSGATGYNARTVGDTRQCVCDHPPPKWDNEQGTGEDECAVEAEYDEARKVCARMIQNEYVPKLMIHVVTKEIACHVLDRIAASKAKNAGALATIRPMRFLAINKCPHHGFYSVSIDDENGGRRITPFKCCGQWKSEMRWLVTDEMLKSFVEAVNG